MAEPSTTEDNGRDADGRFTPGNQFATGNPHAKRVGQLRSSLLRAVTEDDIRDVITRLLALAQEGNVPAAREVPRCGADLSRRASYSA